MNILLAFGAPGIQEIIVIALILGVLSIPIFLVLGIVWYVTKRKDSDDSDKSQKPDNRP